MNDELLPCPFCGDPMKYGIHYFGHALASDWCPLRQHGYADDPKTIAAWNTRAPSPWQDIATAPTDGMPVDLWSSRGRRYSNAVWGVVNYRPVGDPRPDAYGWTDSEGHGSINASGPFTHWMPPPEPPK